MRVLFGTHPDYLEHETGSYHPESPERLQAVSKATYDPGIKDQIIPFLPAPAPARTIMAVHSPSHVESLRRYCLMGGGPLDADTTVSSHSWQAAVLAAGAGLDAVRRLQLDEADAAFLAVRPPGHHATPAQSMGFCLLNNIAITARELVSQGERIVIFDFDAHHGNGTQEIFFADPSVLYLSAHQFPLFPGTGRVNEVGTGSGLGTTINIPIPPGTIGATVLRALEEIATPLIVAFEPTWLLISAGFDGHHRDPLTELGYTARDFSIFVDWATPFVPRGRTIAFLEGGYDLLALEESTRCLLYSLTGTALPSTLGAAVKGSPDIELVTTLSRVRSNAYERLLNPS
ncbi:MAG: histone deacetylase family protein [Ferrimicrobium sp.]